ncbi:polynucleotide adenylyltransferase PcnB [Fluoribacter dumoffii]|uniref:polynucleotide adenylyltransferase PcnB n=1 Tax=Fluoribacter dumoffii TaxID=463 RepID=UPI000E1BBA0A|nr:polynucleotide adenylyltransferase PcnB [Fluoribacter dumoffii]MCW8385568.1 polynucleotide adenylyltransferase PcnB [Fluoribacter dumoffii]MCW8496137.1 polynucleotide adenylyltransferase PcnB [Fluoribacter dumoffii]
MLKKNRAHVPPVASAYIIPRNKHSISKADISSNALKVLNRLIGAGFQAYIVGGSVRDLLLHKAPKDFDVATDATPNQVKSLFRNGRIIGRRFKLVHILFHREIIEVATFRGHAAVDESQQTNERGMLVRDNAYGSLDEDAWRRDFTINSLYYNINDSTIIDFTGGVKDVEQKLIRMIGDPVKRYQEDPVRMLRAIRFSAKLNFKLAPETEAPFPEISHLITHVSNSRLFDEMTKLYQCGNAEAVQRLLMQYGLFQYLCPQTHSLLNSSYPVTALLAIALENTDTRIREDKPVTPAFLFAVLLWFPMIECSKELQKTGIDPLPSIEKAMSVVIAEQNKIISIPKRYTQIIREIWLLQYRFSKRLGGRAFNLLQHPRFRAAYDFMALRALAGDESMELAQWWTAFQDADEIEQGKMVAQLTPDSPKRKRRRKPKSKKTSETQ